jgi:hypothetical protein
MNSGDRLALTMHDTAHGLQVVVNDLTTHQSGGMTASAANGFGQVQFAPDPSTTCNNIPYDFHPMYSTSSENTRVTWAAHSYNIAFSDEIGHFDYCNGSNAITPGASCPAGDTEGSAADTEPTDGDDNACFPASSSSLVNVSGCLGTNTGFDGVPYQSSAWPDGNTRLHPTSIQYTSPLTGRDYNVRYNREAFEADLPRIENPAVCNRSTGVGCTLIPTTDDPAPGGGFQSAAFYPFFSIGRGSDGRDFDGRDNACVWMIGNHIPGSITDFGRNQQYGTLLNLTYTAVGGGVLTRFNDFRQVLSRNPC